jgi:hypothetical protein
VKDLIRDVADMVLGEFCGKPWGVESVKFTISFDRKGRVEDIAHTTIPPEHLDALLERVRDLTKAKCELHLFNAHGDKRYESSVMENDAIVVRKGRLKP